MSVYPLKILTPEKLIYDSSVASITVTGADGRLTVLAGHAPMVASLIKGSISIRTEQETIKGITGHGMLWVDRNETVIMVHQFKWEADEMEELSQDEDEAPVKDTLL